MLYSNGAETEYSDVLDSRTTSPTILKLFIFSTRASFDFQTLDNSMAFRGDRWAGTVSTDVTDSADGLDQLILSRTLLGCTVRPSVLSKPGG